MNIKYDLIVSGGGFAGVSAAIAAAREGLKVLLVDRNNCLGGAASECLVFPYMRYWTKDINTNEKVYLSSGIFAEINKNLSELGGFNKNESSFDEEILKIVLNRMVIAEGIDILFNTLVTDANAENGVVKSITVSNKSGNSEYFADYFIDATGDGDVAVMCGNNYRLGREGDNLCQPMTLCFRAAGVDIDLFKKEKPQMQELYKEYQEQGKIKNIRENILSFVSMQSGVIHFNSTRIVKMNPTDAKDISSAEIMAREQAYELITFLKENFESCRNAKIISTASRIGVRESRMIDGEYVLTAGDLLDCKKFDDGIAVCDYDIDIHNPEGSGTSHHFFEPGTYYSIPYRCLTPKATSNLLVAGRCISSTHEAQASYRIMPTCSSIGQAAGIAAGIAKKSGVGVKEIDVSQLRKRIVECGGKVE